MTVTEPDYANNTLAQRNRDEKAKAIARVLYDDGWSAQAAAALDLPERNETARRAGVRPPSEQTWARVTELLALRYDYDAQRDLPPPALPAAPRNLRREHSPTPVPCVGQKPGCEGEGIHRCSRFGGAWCTPCRPWPAPPTPDPTRTLDALRARAAQEREPLGA